MEQILKLSENLGRLVINEPLLLPDYLRISIEHKGYDLSNAFITLKNGEKQTKLKLTNPFDIPQELLFAGRLFIGIDAYQKGELYRHWDCIPQRIVETQDSKLYLFDELTELYNKLDELSLQMKDKFNELAKKHNGLAETVNAIKENF